MILIKKVLGKVKDEMHSYPIKEFIGLNPKVYSSIHKNKKEEWENKKTLKGVSKAVVKITSYIRIMLMLFQQIV